MTLKIKEQKKINFAETVFYTILYFEKIRITWAGVCLWTKDPDPFFLGSGSG